MGFRISVGEPRVPRDSLGRVALAAGPGEGSGDPRVGFTRGRVGSGGRARAVMLGSPGPSHWASSQAAAAAGKAMRVTAATTRRMRATTRAVPQQMAQPPFLMRQ